jgi:two-component system, NtrC family, response regulator HydG
MRPRVLVVDDDDIVRYTVRGILELNDLDVDEATDGLAALAKLDSAEYHLVISDLRMPRLDGLGLLQAIGKRDAKTRPRFILITAHGSERQAVAAMQHGAYDYFRKPFETDELVAVVRRAVESVRLSAEVERLAGELNLTRSLVFAAPAMSRLAVLVQRVAPRDVTVLLTGESGTGKERVAEALVAASSRAGKPFVRFNCAALNAELADAELFGHSKGAFTGAVRTRPGLFREADGGTILLDEVGELAPNTQAKLLRVLQEGEVRPVGEDHPIKIDVRVVAATHRDLLRMAGEGKFREDLYYRLKVVQLSIPPLRERPEDIPVLARHFLQIYCKRFGVAQHKVTPELLGRLTDYSWPGNVRELENAIESLVALSHEALDLALLPSSGPKAAGATTTPPPATTTPAATAPAPGLELKDRVDAYERGILVQALEQHHGNRSHAARALGVNRATLHAKLRKYSLTNEELDLDE